MAKIENKEVFILVQLHPMWVASSAHLIMIWKYMKALVN